MNFGFGYPLAISDSDRVGSGRFYPRVLSSQYIQSTHTDRLRCCVTRRPPSETVGYLLSQPKLIDSKIDRCGVRRPRLPVFSVVLPLRFCPLEVVLGAHARPGHPSELRVFSAVLLLLSASFASCSAGPLRRAPAASLSAGSCLRFAYLLAGVLEVVLGAMPAPGHHPSELRVFLLFFAFPTVCGAVFFFNQRT